MKNNKVFFRLGYVEVKFPPQDYDVALQALEIEICGGEGLSAGQAKKEKAPLLACNIVTTKKVIIIKVI